MNEQSQLCAGGEDGHDTCRGDSGGPLMMKNEHDLWTIYGIVSFGSKACGRKGYPGVYTNVLYYIEWIFNTIVL